MDQILGALLEGICRGICGPICDACIEFACKECCCKDKKENQSITSPLGQETVTTKSPQATGYNVSNSLF